MNMRPSFSSPEACPEQADPGHFFGNRSAYPAESLISRFFERITIVIEKISK